MQAIVIEFPRPARYGLDYEKLTYFYGGLDQKLTGVKPAELVKDIVA
ncbi:MAG: hypothetical protein IH991_05940 [Planctomycetes bacterium]|nr:hypothetical protein [Planctomycetota bacterium]